MDRKQKSIALARALLTPQNIHIAEEAINKLFEMAMSAKDKARIRDLSALLAMVDEVKEEAKG